MLGPSHMQAAKPTQFTLDVLLPDSSSQLVDDARTLLMEYGQFVAAQPGVASFCYGALEREAADLPQSYLDQRGGAIVARVDGDPVGFVAWRSLPQPELDSAWELKRLWLRPVARGLGLGRTLVQAVIDRARGASKSLLLLDTAPDAMTAALALYRDMGFEECAAYNGRPAEGILYLRKAL